MKFKLGLAGYNEFALMLAAGFPALDHNIPLADMEIRDNFIEFPAEGLWKGLEAISMIAEFLKNSDPGFSPVRTKIWVDGQALEVFLFEKLKLAEEAMTEASRLLRQGRSKKPEKSNAKTKRARLKLEETLRTLQLTV